MSTNNFFTISDKYINKRCGLHCREYQSLNPLNPNKSGIINSKDKFTSCHDHIHITQEERAEIVPKIIDEFLNAGFHKTIRHYEKESDVNKIYKYIQDDTIPINKITGQKTTKSNELLRNYMHHIYDVCDYKGHNLPKLWTKELLENAFKLLDKPNYTVNSMMTELLKKLKYTPVTLYSPIMTKSILNTLNCKTVLDPCIGWGGRMIGTTCIGGHYTGAEPCLKTFKGLKEMEGDLKLGDQVTIYNIGAEEMIDILKLTAQTWDICLTSPPYFNLEIYSDEDTQSINKYKTYDEWVNVFIKPIIDFVCERVTKYSCWSVKNFKTDKKYNLLDDVIKIHEDNGWKLITEYGIKKNTQQNKSANGDVTYVFQKDLMKQEPEPEPEKIMAHIIDEPTSEPDPKPKSNPEPESEPKPDHESESNPTPEPESDDISLHNSELINKIKDKLVKHHELYRHPCKAEYWEDIWDQCINANSDWVGGGHQPGADTKCNKTGIRYQNKAGIINFKNNTVKISSHRTAKYVTIDEKLEFISRKHCDKYVLLSRNDWDSNNKSYYLIIFDSSLLNFYSLKWSNYIITRGKSKGKHNGGYIGEGISSKFSANIDGTGTSYQLWITINIDYIGGYKKIIIP